MAAILLSALGLIVVLLWIGARTLSRSTLAVIVYGPVLYALFGPMVWAALGVPVMFAGERGAAAGTQFAAWVYVFGTPPAVIAGLLHALVLLAGRKFFAAQTRRSGALLGLCLGAAAGAAGTFILFRDAGMTQLGAISGSLTGALFTLRAIRRLANDVESNEAPIAQR